jgi:hypothetical protein
MDDRSREPEIIPFRACEEPDMTFCQLEIHKEHQRLIMHALAKMSTLMTFHWACNNSLISFEDVSPTLFTCEMLKEVEISDNQMFTSPTTTSEAEETHLNSSSGVKVSFRFYMKLVTSNDRFMTGC